MTDILLGVIALSMLTTLIVEVVVGVMLYRMFVSTKARAERLGRALAPLSGHMAAIGGELARARDLAEAQIGRLLDVAEKLEAPARYLFTMAGIVRGVSSAVKPRKDYRSDLSSR